VRALIAVPATLPGRAGSLVTKARAVLRDPGGTITVTIPKTLSDQAGLQRALRADRVPASVRSMSGCQYWEPPNHRSTRRSRGGRCGPMRLYSSTTRHLADPSPPGPGVLLVSVPPKLPRYHIDDAVSFRIEEGNRRQYARTMQPAAPRS